MRGRDHSDECDDDRGEEDEPVSSNKKMRKASIARTNVFFRFLFHFLYSLTQNVKKNIEKVLILCVGVWVFCSLDCEHWHCGQYGRFHQRHSQSARGKREVGSTQLPRVSCHLLPLSE